MSVLTLVLRRSLAALVLLCLPSVALPQTQVPIRFAPGTTGTTINGTIVGNEYIDYVISAGGGQTMRAALTVTGTNGNGSAYFNILPAGKDFDGLYIGSTDDDRTAEVTFPETGDWAIRVYLMGNDADTGKTVGFSIDVSIPPTSASAAPAPAPASAPAQGTARVTGLSAGDLLNMRRGPSTDYAVIGQMGDGDGVHILGCHDVDGTEWCMIEMMTDMREEGWAAGRYLDRAATPATLPLFGDGYPAPGNPCRRVGESAATINFLDDAADLVACPPNADLGSFVAATGGIEIITLDGWTLFTVPRR